MRSFHAPLLCVLIASHLNSSPTAYGVTRIWNPTASIGSINFSNPNRWIQPAVPTATDDLKFQTGLNGSAAAIVDLAQNRSLLITNDVSVTLSLTNPYNLSTSMKVGEGGSGNDSELILHGGQINTPLVSVGATGLSSATATLQMGSSTSSPSKVITTDVVVGGSGSSTGIQSLLEVIYGSLTATNSMTVYAPGEVQISTFGGTVLIDSATPTSAPSLATAVGWTGTGQLTVGGKYSTPQLIVGRNTGAVGTVAITDATTGEVSLGTIDMANSGTATMNLTNATVSSNGVTIGVGGTLNSISSSLGGSNSQFTIRGQVNATAGTTKLDGAVDFQNATVLVSDGATLSVGSSLVGSTNYSGGSITGAGSIVENGSRPVEFSASTTIGVRTFYVGSSTVTVHNNVTARINSRKLSVLGTTEFSGKLVLEGGVWEVNLENNQPWQMFESVMMHRTLGVASVIRGQSPLVVYGTVTADGEGRIESNVINQSTGTITGPTTGPDFLKLTGSVSGRGNFGGNISLSGAYSPGSSAWSVNFARNLNLESTATLNLEIGGPTVGTDYDHVTVSNSLALGGQLAISLLNSFNPTAGQSFDLLDWGSLTGTFAGLSLPQLSTGLAWNTSLLYSTGAISVVSTSLPGDYNGNGIVDAADYVMWRNGGPLQNEVADPGTVSSADYTEWRARFGNTAAGTGSGAGTFLASAVPEPAAGSLSVIALAFALSSFRRGRSNVVGGPQPPCVSGGGH